MRIVVLLAAASFVLLTGCTTQKQLIARQNASIDSLYATNTALQDDLYALQDTLTFYDDIDTGQYYRDRRILQQRITKLEYDLAVCQDSSLVPATPIATLSADDLFEPASATLKPEGAERLTELAGRIRDDYAGHTIRVEGHSDNVPVGPTLQDRYPSNWELSAARASTVVRYLSSEQGLGTDRFEVAAFGDTRPLARNDTAAGRSRNRRVEVLALPQ